MDGDQNDQLRRAANRAGLDSAFVRRPHRDGVSLTTTPSYEVDDLHEVARIANGTR